MLVIESRDNKLRSHIIHDKSQNYSFSGWNLNIVQRAGTGVRKATDVKKRMIPFDVVVTMTMTMRRRRAHRSRGYENERNHSSSSFCMCFFLSSSGRDSGLVAETFVLFDLIGSTVPFVVVVVVVTGCVIHKFERQVHRSSYMLLL